MQHAAARSGDLLRFGVTEPAQQPRAADLPWIGAEYAGHVGPDFQPPGADCSGQRRGGNVGTAPAEQHFLALGIAGDVTLRQRHARKTFEQCDRFGIGIVRAHGVQHGIAFAGPVPRRRPQQLRRVHRRDRYAAEFQRGGSQPPGKPLAQRQHLDAGPVARLAGQGYAAKQLRQVLEFRSEAAFRIVDVHFPGQFAVAIAQLPLEAGVFVAARQLDQGLEPVGDAGQGRVHDDGPHALLAAAAHQARDRVPAGSRGHAGAAELEHCPWRVHALNTLPGFMIPRGSRARLSARIN